MYYSLSRESAMMLNLPLLLCFVSFVMLYGLFSRHPSKFPCFRIRKKPRRYCRRKLPVIELPPPPTRFPRKKPEWVRADILAMHARLRLSHRKLADAFNALHFAATGISVGRTWVRGVFLDHAYERLHRQPELKHRVPLPLAVNRVWGIDTTFVTIAKAKHDVLGVIDHGSRRDIVLKYLKRFNRYAFLGCLLLAFGKFGRPAAIKTDNHPVFRSKLVKRVLRWCGVRHLYSRPATPTDNGRIERMFGTFKSCLRDYAIRDAPHLARSLADFRFWYNVARPHQHLGGRTPEQVWRGVDPYKIAPKAVSEFTAWDGRLRGLVLRH